MKKQALITAIIFLCFSCIIACVPLKKTIRPHFTLTSDHFILCTLTKDESPLLLARQFLDNAQNAWMIEEANPNAKYKSGETIVIPLKIQNKAGLFLDGFQMVPILCYHRFAKQCTSQLCMPEDVFTDHMLFLKNNNYQVISLQMLYEFLTYNKALPKNSVVITIDDGYRSVYDVAWPILKKFGFTATLFIYNDFIGGGSALTWDEIREMKADGFEIGSHTLSHADLTHKKKGEAQNVYISRITKEIFESKKNLDRKLNQDTRFFAYPFGKANTSVIELSRKAGYLLGLSVNRGGNPFPTSFFQLHRDQILSRNPDVFARRLKTFYSVSLKDNKNE